MDRTDGWLIVTAIAVLIFAISVFGVGAGLGVTGLWAAWLGFVAVAAGMEAYRESDD